MVLKRVTCRGRHVAKEGDNVSPPQDGCLSSSLRPLSRTVDEVGPGPAWLCQSFCRVSPAWGGGVVTYLRPIAAIRVGYTGQNWAVNPQGLKAVQATES